MSISLEHMIAARGTLRTMPPRPAVYRPALGQPAPHQWMTWSMDDAPGAGATFSAARERICSSLDIVAGEQVLEVTAGHSAAALPDVADLPFPDASFDVVLSGFGAMFAPDHEQMAAELLRVCRPGGRIGLTGWRPQSFNGELMSVVASYFPPPRGRDNPLDWGSREYLNGLFGDSADALGAAVRTHTWRFPTPDEWLEAWRSPGQPLRSIYLTIDTERRERLSLELLALVARFNEARNGSMLVPGEYLEFLVHKCGRRAR